MKSIRITLLLILILCSLVIKSIKLRKDKDKDKDDKERKKRIERYEKEIYNRKIKILHEGLEAPSLNGIEPLKSGYKAQPDYGGKHEAVIVNGKEMNVDNYSGYTLAEGIPYSS